MMRRWRAQQQDPESGMSMMEIVVTMSIMATFMAIFTVGIAGVFGNVGKDESLNSAQSQLNLMFLRLDKEVRYASALSKPGPVGGDRYVEFLTTNTGTPRCTQLRLTADGTMQRRAWTQGASITSGEPWSQLATGLSSDEPFKVLPADPTFNFQRLRVWVKATAGSTGDGAGSTGSGTTNETDVTFTALNTSLSTNADDDTVCTEGRSQP